MSPIKQVEHMKIPLQDIILSTGNFAQEKPIGVGGFGRVYKGQSHQHGTIAVKRLDIKLGQGYHQFMTEVALLSAYKHENIVSLIGFCDEDGEKVLVYKYETNGSLDKHITSKDLNWIQRLRICIDAARGLKYLHEDVGPQHRIIHRDVKSANILLDESWKAKISDFGLSKIGPANVQHTFLITHVCGTIGYVDPEYLNGNVLTKESDVYSFGVVLSEVLCGRPALVSKPGEKHQLLAKLARKHYKQGTLAEFIDSRVQNEMNSASFNTFSSIAFRCLSKKKEGRPLMSEVVKELEKALDYQLQLASSGSGTSTEPSRYELSKIFESGSGTSTEPSRHISQIMSNMKGVEHLKVSLEEIKMATNNFNQRNLIATGRFGNVYTGKLTLSGQEMTCAVKRLDSRQGQGNHEFLMEIQLLLCYKHKNIVSLVGFCDESEEKLIIYEYVKHGSLDRYLSSTKLSWIQRLKISLGAARGFNYLHNDVGPKHRVLHRDIKSSNILLNENLEAKVFGFGLSKIVLSDAEYTSACGTFGYVDPQYVKTGILTKESDVYSFGVVLFELLCGRPVINSRYDDDGFLVKVAREAYKKNKLFDIVFLGIKDEINLDSLNIFFMVAYDCLKDNRIERPTMEWIVEKLERAYQIQVSSKTGGFVRVGTWGKQSGDSEDN